MTKLGMEELHMVQRNSVKMPVNKWWGVVLGTFGHGRSSSRFKHFMLPPPTSATFFGSCDAGGGGAFPRCCPVMIPVTPECGHHYTVLPLSLYNPSTCSRRALTFKYPSFSQFFDVISNALLRQIDYGCKLFHCNIWILPDYL